MLVDQHSETKTWLTKAHNRKIVSDEFYDEQIQKLDKLGIKMNNYIATLASKTR
jgi:hypothetical protein